MEPEISSEPGFGAYRRNESDLFQNVLLPAAVLRVRGRFQDLRRTPVRTKLWLKRFPRTRCVHPVFLWFSSFLGGRYDWTTGGLHDGNEWRKYRVVPRAHASRPLKLIVYAFFVRSGSKFKGLLDFQGRRGSASVVRWNLRPVIFGVEFPGFSEIRLSSSQPSCLWLSELSSSFSSLS